MTYEQKERIRHMRVEGLSYARIAETLCVSENTVKSFCRRNNLGGVSKGRTEGVVCRQCAAPLLRTVGAKRKKFCRDQCRMMWWNNHPEAVQRKAFYPYTCAFCGSLRQSYGNKKRKYCSRTCYGKSRAVRHE